MILTSDGAWLTGVRHVLSPNCDERPAGEISLIVVHGISLPPGEYGGPWIDQLFTNQLDTRAHPYFAAIADMRVSTHVLIRRDGELVQYVPCHQRAWQLEGRDDEPYEEVQYRRLAELIGVLRERFPGIARDALVGHSDIAPGRKTDPGPAFEWERLRTLLA